jgi:hypothetical protein
MIAHAIPKPETLSTTFEIKHRGRLYGTKGISQEKASRLQPYELHESPEGASLSHLLADSIMCRLPWSQPRAASDDEVFDLVRAYTASLDQLTLYREEFHGLVRAVCLSNLEFRQGKGPTHEGARDEAITKKVEQLVAQVATKWPPVKTILNPPFLLQSPEVIRAALDAELRQYVKAFVNRIFQALAKLVDQQIAGLVEWWPENFCNYHYFRQTIQQENEGASTTITDSYSMGPRPAVDTPTGRAIIGTRRTKKIKGKGRNVHELERHEHMVINAVRTSLENSAVVMIPPAAELVKSIPAWLRPFVEVVDGTLYWERVIPKERSISHWEDATETREPILASPIERPRFKWDPAICIGSFVLFGWGPREIEAEQARLQDAQRQKKQADQMRVAEHRFLGMTAICSVLTLLALSTLTRVLQGEGGSAIGLPLALGAIAAAWQSAVYWQVALRGTASLRVSCAWTARFFLLFVFTGWIVVRSFYPVSPIVPLLCLVILGLLLPLRQWYAKLVSLQASMS